MTTKVESFHSHTNQDGREVSMHVFKDAPPTLEEAQTIVGGLVDIVHTRVPCDDTECQYNHAAQILVNDEGLLMNLPPNQFATAFHPEVLVGNIILLIEDALWT